MNATMRPAAIVEGTVRILLPETGWREVAPGSMAPATLPPTWRLLACYDVTQCCFVLIFAREGEGNISWIVAEDLRFVCHLGDVASQAPEAILRGLTRLATEFFADVRVRFEHHLSSRRPALWRVGRRELIALVQLAHHSAQAHLLSSDTMAWLLRAGTLQSCISEEALERVFGYRQPPLETLVATGRMEIPAIGRSGLVDAAYLVSYTEPSTADDGLSSIYLCSEASSGSCFFLFLQYRKVLAIYLPKENMFILRSEDELSRFDASTRLRDLTVALLLMCMTREADVLAKSQQCAMLTVGSLHLGHALWDELFAIDRLTRTSEDLGLPCPNLYILSEMPSADLYGPIETIFPELQGRVLRGSSLADVLSHAMAMGSEVVLRHGRGVTQRMRSRLAHVLGEFGRQSSIGAALRAFGPLPGPIVALGLRSNRQPTDFMGFYERLAAAIRDRFGRALFILDGMNRNNDGNGAAACVFNGSKQLDDTIVDGSTQLAEEMAWAQDLSRRLGALDVAVLNCVGTTLFENLLWDQQIDFFVAPVGAGLAKFRWVLDKPGFVLSSRINLTHYSLHHCYDDPERMEAPYSPLHFTDHCEVQDIGQPGGEPRSAAMSLIPYPDGFAIDEAQVIPRILDLIAQARETRIPAIAAE